MSGASGSGALVRAAALNALRDMGADEEVFHAVAAATYGALRESGELTYPEAFSVGDRIRHSIRGAGVIRSIEPSGLHIEFDDTPGRISGVFDERWFLISGATIELAQSERTGA